MTFEIEVKVPGSLFILFVLAEDGICAVYGFGCGTDMFCRRGVRGGVDAGEGGSTEQAGFRARCLMGPALAFFLWRSHTFCVSCS